jgi:hypothetical protein
MPENPDLLDQGQLTVEQMKRKNENTYNLYAALLKIGGDLMIAAANAADTAARVTTVENKKIQVIEASGLADIDRDGLRLANESLDVATRAFEALHKYGVPMIEKTAHWEERLNPK